MKAHFGRKDDIIYHNYLLIDPNGTPVTRVGRKKARWYLRKELGDLIDEKTIKLRFNPKYIPHNDYFNLSEKENKCAVCGATVNITGHHCVPYAFKKWFPLHMKNYTGHDVVPLCTICHRNYEKTTPEFIEQLRTKYNVPHNSKELREFILNITRCFSYYKALSMYKNVMPSEKQKEMMNFIRSILGNIELKDIKDISHFFNNTLMRDITYILADNPAQEMVFKLKTDEDIEEFIYLWRKHFIDTMNPKYLNPHWNIKRSKKDFDDPSQYCKEEKK